MQTAATPYSLNTVTNHHRERQSYPPNTQTHGLTPSQPERLTQTHKVCTGARESWSNPSLHPLPGPTTCMLEMGSRQAHTLPLSLPPDIPVGTSGWVPTSILALPSRSGEGPTHSCPRSPQSSRMKWVVKTSTPGLLHPAQVWCALDRLADPTSRVNLGGAGGMGG